MNKPSHPHQNQRRGRSRNNNNSSSSSSNHNNNNNNNGKRHQQSRNSSYDSNGPDGRVRGTAQQVYDKYLSLAQDAISAGENISAEGFYQFAEHYQRIVNVDNASRQTVVQQQAEQNSRREQANEPQPSTQEIPITQAQEGAPSAPEARVEKPVVAEAPVVVDAPIEGIPADISVEAAPDVAVVVDEAPAKPRRGRPPRAKKPVEEAVASDDTAPSA